MTHTHDDRVAEHQPGMCSAYGCPLHGSMSDATNGGGDWWCPLHFGKDASQLQAITSAMMRRRWLSLAIKDVRANARPKHDWRPILKRIADDLQAQRRADLCWDGKEKATRWVLRLEAALMAYVAEDVVPVTVQATLPGQSQDTWANVAQSLPQWA